jgi:hypothetical protein
MESIPRNIELGELLSHLFVNLLSFPGFCRRFEIKMDTSDLQTCQTSIPPGSDISIGFTGGDVSLAANASSFTCTNDFRIPSSLTGDAPRSDILAKRTRYGDASWQGDTELHTKDGIDYSNSIRERVSVNTSTGQREYLVNMRAQVNDRKRSIAWYLEFEKLYYRASNGRDSTTGANEEGSMLYISVDASEGDASLIDVNVTYTPYLDKSRKSQASFTLHGEGPPDLWHISRMAAGQWLKEQKGAQSIAKSLLQMELDPKEANIFAIEVEYLLDAICARGKKLQERRVRWKSTATTEKSSD